MKLLVLRKEFDFDRTIGEMFCVNYETGITEFIGYTLEDAVLTHKIYGESAIPSGEYKLILSFSNRFKKIMPELLDVPEFRGIRIHAGNTEHDTLGCILLGAKKDKYRIFDCAKVNSDLIELIRDKNIQRIEII